MNTADIWVDDKARIHHVDAYHRENTWTRPEAEALFIALGTLLDKTTPMPKRYAVQIAGMDSTPLMLCNDGSIWERERAEWKRVPNPPQPMLAVVPDVVTVMPLADGVGPSITVAMVEQTLCGRVIARPGKPEVPA